MPLVRGWLLEPVFWVAYLLRAEKAEAAVRPLQRQFHWVTNLQHHKGNTPGGTGQGSSSMTTDSALEKKLQCSIREQSPSTGL
jgi:hypothetical protein